MALIHCSLSSRTQTRRCVNKTFFFIDARTKQLKPRIIYTFSCFHSPSLPPSLLFSPFHLIHCSLTSLPFHETASTASPLPSSAQNPILPVKTTLKHSRKPRSLPLQAYSRRFQHPSGSPTPSLSLVPGRRYHLTPSVKEFSKGTLLPRPSLRPPSLRLPAEAPPSLPA